MDSTVFLFVPMLLAKLEGDFAWSYVIAVSVLSESAIQRGGLHLRGKEPGLAERVGPALHVRDCSCPISAA